MIKKNVIFAQKTAHYPQDMKQVIVIGAGAAGCFAAIEIKCRNPKLQVTLLEKGKRPLAKVAITGGGRCNITNSFAEVKSMENVYPRGYRLMKKLFHHFSNEDTCQWFENSGIRLVTQDDQCVFPQSQDAMEVVNNLVGQLNKYGVKLITNTRVELIKPSEDGYLIVTSKGEMKANNVLVTTGGHPSIDGFDMLRELDLEIVPPLPSLFSFNINDDSLKSLMGTVVKNTIVTIPGTKLKAQGPLLITHWGASGPAILKLSSYGARILAERNYVTDVSIHWLTSDQSDILTYLRKVAATHKDKKITSIYPDEFNARLWTHLVTRSSISLDARWKELSDKAINRLMNTLTNDVYHVTGKNRFKDEFVTCGGVSLNSLNHKTLEAKNHPGLYFAGEITDVDAITGGFNLQAAWTMASVVANAITQ